MVIGGDVCSLGYVWFRWRRVEDIIMLSQNSPKSTVTFFAAGPVTLYLKTTLLLYSSTCTP